MLLQDILLGELIALQLLDLVSRVWNLLDLLFHTLHDLLSKLRAFIKPERLPDADSLRLLLVSVQAGEGLLVVISTVCHGDLLVEGELIVILLLIHLVISDWNGSRIK